MAQIRKFLISLLRWLWTGIICLPKSIWRFLTHNETPLGVTLLLFIATAGLTYYFTPELNQTFEQQKMVSVFVTENLKDLNNASQALVSDTGILIRDLTNGKLAQQDLKSKISAQITGLQWRAVQLDIIFEDKKSKAIIQQYKTSLTNLGKVVESAKSKKDSDQIAMAAIIFTDSSVKVITALAVKAGLRIETSIDTSLLQSDQKQLVAPNGLLTMTW